MGTDKEDTFHFKPFAKRDAESSVKFNEDIDNDMSELMWSNKKTNTELKQAKQIAKLKIDIKQLKKDVKVLKKLNTF